MRLFLVGIFIIIHVVMALSLRLAGTPHNHVLLENTLAPHHLNAPEVVAIAKEYKRRLLQIAIGLSIFSFLMLLPKYEAFVMTLLWVNLLLLSVYYICEILYIRKLHRLIVEKNWQLPIEPILIDTQLIQTKNKKLVSWLWFLPSLALLIIGSVLTLQKDSLTTWPLLFSTALIWLLFIIFWYSLSRLSVRPMTNDQKINRQYNDLTKHYWSLLTVTGAYMILPILYLPLFRLDISGWAGKLWVGAGLFILIASAFASIGFLLRLRQKQDQLLSQIPDYRYMGEDQYWRYGVYINPNDTRLFLPDRIGMNMSVNLGRPVGKLIMGAVGLLLVGVMVAILSTSYLYDFTADPFKFSLEENQVELTAPLAISSTIPVEKIESVTLIDHINGAVVRTNGYGTENYSVGHLQVDGKSANFYLSMQSKPILLIKTKKTDYYYTNKNPELTKEAYEKLR